ncbi:zinc finger protein 518B [Rhinatrema bivittatum]|uniref:zinc finger protein 518B n=1 Tax=Rhinatrema bivittatum TaxID=194408 RepID=UPI00112AA1DA|nr:zinc finger protein 518B [Rhinatrema bivittatum]
MQLKNMREILPNLCIDQEDERNNVLVSSPRQVTNVKVNQSHHCSRGAEAESGKSSLVLCKNCCCSFEPLLQNQLRRTEANNESFCGKCSLSLPSCFSDITDAFSTNIEDIEKRTLSKMEEKTVNAIRLEKYHCDKCRFTTKDHLQFKKHTLLHDEIKFICSHCNYVSYTKGEFQRHLVKHTGTFPYKCEYCDYGAVRNDYIVKHTKRLHESIHEAHSVNISTKCQSRHTVLKGQVEELKSSFQKASNSFPDSQIEACHTVALHSNVENSDSGICIKENDEKSNMDGGLCVKINESRALEVELISPVNEPLLPEMTLTAIAPPDLVVPSHSFAQLLEVKVINGKQQLVLKLFQQNERCLELANTEECCTSISGQILHELNNKISAEQSGPLVTNRACEEKCCGKNYSSLSHLSEDTKNTCSGFCSDLSSSNKKLIPAQVKHMAEELLEDIRLNSNFTNSFPETQVDESEIKGCHKFYMKDKQAKDNTYSTSTSLAFTVNPPQDDLAQIVLDSKNGYCSPQTDLFINDKSALNEDSVDAINTSLHNCLSNTYMTKEPLKISAMERNTSFSKNVSYSEVNHDNDHTVYQSLDMCSLPLASLEEEQDKEVNMNVKEGPYISSVFSLCSGTENIPEGIEWDENPSCKTELRFPDFSIKSASSLFLSKAINCNNSDLLDDLVSVDVNSGCKPLSKGSATQKDSSISVHKLCHDDIALDNCISTEIKRYNDKCLNMDASRDSSLSKQCVPTIICKQKFSCETELSQSNISHLPKTEEVNELAVKFKASESQLQNCKTNEDVLNVDKNQSPSDANRDFNLANCSKGEQSVIEKDENQSRNLSGDNIELGLQVPDLSCSKNQQELCLVSKEGKIVHDQLPITEALQITEKDQLQLSLSLETEANSIMKPSTSVNETDQNVFHQHELSRKEQLRCSQAQPQVHAVKSKRGLAKNLHIGSPIFIPKGTVLRVVNSNSNNAVKIHKSSSISVNSVYCSETLLPRPVPFTTSAKIIADLPLSKKKELCKSRNPRRPFDHKLGKEIDIKLSNKKCTTMLNGKCDDLNKQKFELKRSASPLNKIKQVSSKDHVLKKKVKLQSEKGSVCNEKETLTRARRLRLMPVSMSQLIKCPRRNQPVVVLNHPDVDSLEVVNVMKTISKYKAHVLKVFLSERTIYCLGIKQHQKRLTYQSWEVKAPVKEQHVLKMKLKKFQKSNCQVASGIMDDFLQCVFKCWFCGRQYENQEEWISHGQRHLIEATRDWDILSFPSKT